MRTYIFFILFSLFSFACKQNVETEEEKLLLEGLENSAENSAKFLNFFYENTIERNELEYPEYYAQTIAKLHKIWNVSADFDNLIADTLNLHKITNAKLYSAYAESLDGLNEIISEDNSTFTILSTNILSAQANAILYKNHVENCKNILLQKLLNKMPKAIQRKQYYAFQTIGNEVVVSDELVEVYFNYEHNKAPYNHQVLIDSIVGENNNKVADYSIDNSLVFGKIIVNTNKKGKFEIFGKVKIVGENGETSIPFTEEFLMY